MQKNPSNNSEYMKYNKNEFKNLSIKSEIIKLLCENIGHFTHNFM
jgi:hypothetical protein